MNTLAAIADRRSIRKYKATPVDAETIRRVLTAATQAPSGKNRQPWRFYVVRGERRAEMVRVMREGIAKRKAQGDNPGSSEWTANVMEQAPVTIFIFNEKQENDKTELSFTDNLWMTVDVQSIGAAIQNMLLAATELGLGSLWICDVFYAYDGLCQWLGENHQMVAAVALGYPDEAPGPRPRMSVDEVTTWVGEGA
ncbi:MAG: nitroreductase family protein [Anaerolineae bacterium]